MSDISLRLFYYLACGHPEKDLYCSVESRMMVLTSGYNILYNKPEKMYIKERGADMDSLIKKIRMACNMTQPEFAEALQTTFASINRWENGHNQPGKAAQKQILEYCAANQVSVADIVLSHIGSQTADILVSENRKLLFHGSKSGISGKIKPLSREHCDFGPGFMRGRSCYSR